VESVAENLEEYFEERGGTTPLGSEVEPSSHAMAFVDNLAEGYLVGMGYDGEKHRAYLKLYDPQTRRIYFWVDTTSHKPYCLSRDSLEVLEKNEAIVKHQGFERLERLTKYDALKDQKVEVVKIVAKDPLAIGGRPSGSIRDLIKAWEADIKYVESYLYDNDLLPGMPYSVTNGVLKVRAPRLDTQPTGPYQQVLESEGEEYQRLALKWIRLLECPVPDYLKASLDIEVYSDVPSRVPDPGMAEYPVICASIVGSDNKKYLLILERENSPPEKISLDGDMTVTYFKKEDELLRSLFRAMQQYPVIITFNGDDFDLRYLWHRARNLQIQSDEVPIDLLRDSASLANGVHIDLYKFFFNRSIQVYAFSQKYQENTLDAVTSSLLETGKIELTKPISELSYPELAAYCLNDSEITLSLTTFSDNLVMKLITMLSRISYMSLEDVSRQGVSNWIRSMLYKEHRERGMLIPRSDEILEMKGETTTHAIIKGKKYKGAIVVEPIPGIHFQVSVLDFASLYPSIIKVWNLGYSTVECPHEDPRCKNNRVPETPLWVCRRNRALESLVVGTLRDLRVSWYKPKSKDKLLPLEIRQLYNVVQNALKVVLNASYGVFGAETFSLYCPPVAEATAAIGRYVITRTIEKAKSLGVTVVYGDTDSIFLGKPDERQLDEIIRWSKAEFGMELEIDKQYRFVALSQRKKNYLGVYPDGHVDIKGLTGKKRHVPIFLKNAFYEMITTLSGVQSEAEFEEAKKKIKDIARKCYVNLRDRKIALSDLAFRIMISKSIEGYRKTTPQHVKAAQLLEKSGREIKPGDLISFVKVIGGDGVKPVELASLREIDVPKYVEYISSTFEQVLDALGTDFQDLIGNKKLEAFF